LDIAGFFNSFAIYFFYDLNGRFSMNKKWIGHFPIKYTFVVNLI